MIEVSEVTLHEHTPITFTPEVGRTPSAMPTVSAMPPFTEVPSEKGWTSLPAPPETLAAAFRSLGDGIEPSPVRDAFTTESAATLPVSQQPENKPTLAPENGFVSTGTSVVATNREILNEPVSVPTSEAVSVGKRPEVALEGVSIPVETEKTSIPVMSPESSTIKVPVSSQGGVSLEEPVRPGTAEHPQSLNPVVAPAPSAKPTETAAPTPASVSTSAPAVIQTLPNEDAEGESALEQPSLKDPVAPQVILPHQPSTLAASQPTAVEATRIAPEITAHVTETMRAAAEAVAATVRVSPELATTGRGEIQIQLKRDVLDGSGVRFEVQGGDLKITLSPATQAVAQLLETHLETFRTHLAERVANWRINVGVTAWEPKPRLGRMERDE